MVSLPVKSSRELPLPRWWRTIAIGSAAQVVLALQHDADGRTIHVVWAVPAGERRPTILVTAYRPDPDLWDTDFKRRTRR